MTATILQFPKSFVPANLSHTARAILLDLRSLYDGTNNGRLPHSLRDGERCSGSNRATVVAARRELKDRGLVVEVAPGESGRATLWLLKEYAASIDPTPSPSPSTYAAPPRRKSR